MTENGAPERRLAWLLVEHEHRQTRIFTLGPETPGDGETLPVFGFREEAEAFLRLEEPGGAWEVRRTTAGELLSLLQAPYKHVRRIAFDPLPVVGCGMVLDVSSPGWSGFLRNLAGGMRAVPALTPHGSGPRVGVQARGNGTGRRATIPAAVAGSLDGTPNGDGTHDGDGRHDDGAARTT